MTIRKLTLRIRLFAVMLSVIFGASVGLVTVDRVDAATTINLLVQPGTSSTTSASATCGWHIACKSPYTAGPGFDFSNSGGANVYFRYFGQRNDGVSGAIGTATVGYSEPGCKRITVTVKNLGARIQGTVLYIHSQNPATSSFNMNGYPLGNIMSQTNIGKTSSTEICDDWTAAHLHQESSWTKNGPNTTYPNAPSLGSPNPKAPNNAAHWLHTKSWMWTY